MESQYNLKKFSLIDYVLQFFFEPLINVSLPLLCVNCELLNDIDVVQRINIQRLSWLGHVVKMKKDALAQKGI